MTPIGPSIGDVIADKYRIEQKLGGGGMGTVFSAKHLMTGRRFAIKWMSTRAVDDGAARERFIREFQAAGSIEHANVAAALDVGSHDGFLFIVMEYLDGESLAARIARGPMPPTECVPIVVAAMRGVAAAHRLDIVHRDLKPANIFICQSPGRSDLDVKVLDFGVMKAINARASQLPTITARGIAVGTPPYMAPEQVLALPSVDHRVDVYAFGVILYEALSGRVPYAGETGMRLLERIVRGPAPPLSHVIRGVPIGLEATIMRALRRDPRQRFSRLDEFAACLSPWASEPEGTRRETPRPVAVLATAEPVSSETRVSAPADLWGPLNSIATARSTTGTLLSVQPSEPARSVERQQVPASQPMSLAVPPAAALLSQRLASITRAPVPSSRTSREPASPAVGGSRGDASVARSPVNSSFAVATTASIYAGGNQPASVLAGGNRATALATMSPARAPLSNEPPPARAPAELSWAARALIEPPQDDFQRTAAASGSAAEIWTVPTQFVQAPPRPSALRSPRGIAASVLAAGLVLGASVMQWTDSEPESLPETAGQDERAGVEHSVETALRGDVAALEPQATVEQPAALEPQTTVEQPAALKPQATVEQPAALEPQATNAPMTVSPDPADSAMSPPGAAANLEGSTPAARPAGEPSAAPKQRQRPTDAAPGRARVAPKAAVAPAAGGASTGSADATAAPAAGGGNSSLDTAAKPDRKTSGVSLADF